MATLTDRLYYYCLPISAAFLLAAFLGVFGLKVIRRHRRCRISPFRLFFVIAAFAVYAAMLPLEAKKQTTAVFPVLKWVQIFTFSLFSTMKVFSGGLDFDIIRNFTVNTVTADGLIRSPETIYILYSYYITFLAVLCPFLSVGLILSFFRNMNAYGRLFLHRRRDVCLFSSLNKRSLSLAADIADKQPRTLIAFCGVRFGDTELAVQARDFGAACFSKDILSVRTGLHSCRKTLRLFTMDDAEEQNEQVGLSLLKKYFTQRNTWLYISSEQYECELMIVNGIRRLSDGDTVRQNHINVRRINEAQTVVYNELYRNGVHTVFHSAEPADADGTKRISALIIGMERCSLEMMRALPWYCQMDNYTLSINAFSADPEAAERFSLQYPELIAETSDTQIFSGEHSCRIKLHAGVMPGSSKFSETLRSIGKVTYVFIDTNSDEQNIRTAVNLRTIFRRIGQTPVIRAVLRNTNMEKALQDMKNFRGDSYDIGFVGDVESLYSMDSVLDSELDDLSRFIHMQWIGDNPDESERIKQEDEFRLYEYNYRSSMASAIHKTACLQLKPPTGQDFSEKDLQVFSRLEHRRWNAYMRSEGFISAAPEDGLKRDYIAYQHGDLMDYDQLNALHKEEALKDTRIMAESLRYIWKRILEKK